VTKYTMYSPTTGVHVALIVEEGGVTISTGHRDYPFTLKSDDFCGNKPITTKSTTFYPTIGVYVPPSVEKSGVKTSTRDRDDLHTLESDDFRGNKFIFFIVVTKLIVFSISTGVRVTVSVEEGGMTIYTGDRDNLLTFKSDDFRWDGFGLFVAMTKLTMTSPATGVHVALIVEEDGVSGSTGDRDDLLTFKSDDFRGNKFTFFITVTELTIFSPSASVHVTVSVEEGAVRTPTGDPRPSASRWSIQYEF